MGFTTTGKFTELTLIGNEGMTGIALILGGRLALGDCITRTPCTSLSLPCDVFLRVLEKRQPLKDYLLRYVKAYLAAVAANAIAQSRATVEQRLARTLLMCFDRVDEPYLLLTHEALAEMTGARRSSVTNAIHKLEALYAVRSDRGMIELVDRNLLLGIAGCFYGSSERDYDRIMGEAATLPALTMRNGRTRSAYRAAG